MRITRREKKFWEQHLSCVRHITLDPKGPGVVRLHMIPPRAEGKDEPFLLLLNGAKLIPLNLSWAILLANRMAQLRFSGISLAPFSSRRKGSSFPSARGGIMCSRTTPGPLGSSVIWRTQLRCCSQNFFSRRVIRIRISPPYPVIFWLTVYHIC